MLLFKIFDTTNEKKLILSSSMLRLHELVELISYIPISRFLQKDCLRARTCYDKGKFHTWTRSRTNPAPTMPRPAMRKGMKTWMVIAKYDSSGSSSSVAP